MVRRLFLVSDPTFFFDNCGVRTSLRALQLIPQGPEVNDRVNPSMTLRRLKLVTIGEQTQDWTTSPTFRFDIWEDRAYRILGYSFSCFLLFAHYFLAGILGTLPQLMEVVKLG